MNNQPTAYATSTPPSSPASTPVPTTVSGTSTGTGSGSGRFPRGAVVYAALVPIMVLTGFAMLAIVPLALLVRATLRDNRLRPLRPWLAVLVVTYATPLVLWAILPDRALSLTKDMHPAFVPIIVGAGVVVLAALARLWVTGRRERA